MSNQVAREAVALHKIGVVPLPLGPNSKRPLVEDWTNFNFNPNEAKQVFAGNKNLGVILGKRSGGLIDVDLDCHEAVQLAHLLPKTNCTFGRASRHVSHQIYRINGDTKSVKYLDPLRIAKARQDASCREKVIILELRGDGCQTMFPPSIHPEGEAIEWRENGQPAIVDRHALVQSCIEIVKRVIVQRHGEESLNDPVVKEYFASFDQHKAKLSDRAKATPPSQIADGRKASFGATALQAELNAVSSTPEGSRNARLFEAGVKCASLAAGGCLDGKQAQAALLSAAQCAGLTKAEAIATIQSAWRIGTQNPRLPKDKPFDGSNQHSDALASKGQTMGNEQPNSCYSVADPEVQAKSLPKVSLIQASGISLEPIGWKWPGYIAAGKFHVLAGSPSAGKTTLAETFAATISNGGAWPDGSIAEVGNTIIWSGEDDPRDTLVPRLVAAGANLDRIYFIGPVQDGEDKRSFDPSKDIAALETCIEEIDGAALLVIDPIVQAVAGDSHRNNEVRRDLQPVVDLAEKTGIAVLGIAHLSKGTQGRDPLERLNGSLAFGALARIVLMAAVETNPKDGDVAKRFLTRAKSNIGPDGGGFEYAVQQTQLETDARIVTSRIVFGEALEGTARQILATAEAEEENKSSGALNTAVFFLKSILAHGEVAQTRIQAEAEQSSISYRTLARAKKELDIVSRKDRFNGGWFWSLPVNIELADEECQDQGCQNSLTKKLGTLGTLRENQSLTREGVWHPSMASNDYVFDINGNDEVEF